MIPELLARLIELVNHQVLSVQIPIIRTIGNMTTGTDEETQQLINAGLMQSLAQTLQH